MAGILPRLGYTVFTFAQPFLVERVLNFMTEPEHVNSDNYARGLIAAYAIVYVGIAVGSQLPSIIILVNERLICLLPDFIRRIYPQGIPTHHHDTGESSHDDLRQDTSNEYIGHVRCDSRDFDEHRY